MFLGGATSAAYGDGGEGKEEAGARPFRARTRGPLFKEERPRPAVKIVSPYYRRYTTLQDFETEVLSATSLWFHLGRPTSQTCCWRGCACLGLSVNC